MWVCSQGALIGGYFLRSIVKCTKDQSGNKQTWIERLLREGPCVRLLGL